MALHGLRPSVIGLPVDRDASAGQIHLIDERRHKGDHALHGLGTFGHGWRLKHQAMNSLNQRQNFTLDVDGHLSMRRPLMTR